MSRHREGLLGTYERLALVPEARTIVLTVSAPIASHADAIILLGPGAEYARIAESGGEPECTVAVLPTHRPVHPETDEMALAEACLACLESLIARGELRPRAVDLETRFARLAAQAREDRLLAIARRGKAQ